MSLRSLALAYLESQKKLSQDIVTINSFPSVPTIPTGPTRTRGTSGLINWGLLQAEADRRNAKAKREHSTARYCRCGSLAECAWPLEGRHEMWRCFRCLEPGGSA